MPYLGDQPRPIRRASINLLVFRHRGQTVRCGEREAVFRADIHAIAAGDAEQAVDGPLLRRLAADGDGSCGTLLAADAAESAGVANEDQLAAGARYHAPGRERVFLRRRILQRPLERQLSHGEVSHITFRYN